MFRYRGLFLRTGPIWFRKGSL